MTRQSLGSAFRVAFRGFIQALKRERNIKIELAGAVLVCVIGYVFHLNEFECALIAFCIGLVLSVELLNSAVETVVDLVSPEWQRLAGRAKDLAAAAVLVAALTSVVVGLCVFVPKVLTLISKGSL